MKTNNTCKLCGSPIDLEEYIPHLAIPQCMAKEHLCYHCAFWVMRKEWDKHLEDKLAIITPDYSHWILSGFADRNLLVSTGTFTKQPIYPTKTHLAILTDDSLGFQLAETNNLSHQGVIPGYLRGQFKVNAVFLTPAHWKELQDTKNITREHIQNLINREINKK